MAEMERFKIEPCINKMLSTTKDKESASKFSSNWNRPAMLQMEGNIDIPFLDLGEIFSEYNNEVIVAPFTRKVSMEEMDENESFSSLKCYKMVLENQELEILADDEKDEIYNDILKNANLANEKLKESIELDKENAIHYENIRKLEQLLAKHNFSMEQENYEIDTTEAERQSDLDDIARINAELNSLKETATKIFEMRQLNCKFILDWKQKLAIYLRSECEEIKQKYKKIEEKDDCSISQTENKIDEIKKVTDEMKKEETPRMKEVKSECMENVAMINTLLNNIKSLISKQQNHARIAEEIDSNYKALNNAFEMKNFAEELEALVQAILKRLENTANDDEKQIDKISQTSLQISTLLNYLNNAKAGVGKKISRFDEINIIEENELKKEIAETIKNIRCEAELKKLRDDLEIIEEKSSFKKFLGKLTGRNKIDETMIDQIQVRQTAIRKTFKAKMPLAYNYSIHELIAEIEMFIKENKDDDLVLEDVNMLRKIKNVLKKNFVIIDSKVVSIIDQKTGKNLPLASRKLSKKELIEIDTYRFLNKYGYDKTIDSKEPEYQDTLANEIKRIVDYIKSSEVLE